jgi:hypothetical protein
MENIQLNPLHPDDSGNPSGNSWMFSPYSDSSRTFAENNRTFSS